MLLGIRVATVLGVRPLPEYGALRYINRGNANPPEPVYWVEVALQWEKSIPESPRFVVVLKGDQFVSLRDTNPD